MTYPRRLLAFFCLSVVSVSAQNSIFEQLAVVQTDFEITLNDHALDVAKQGISLRAVKERREYKVGEGETRINEFAYQSYHLEFAFTQKYRVRDGFEVIEFFEGNDLIHTISIDRPSRQIATPNGRLFETSFLAVNLEGVPLLMLDSVDRINFRRSK